MLHLGENVSEMLAVLAAFAVPGMRSILGSLERRLGQYLVDTPEPRRLNVGQPRRHAPISHRPIQLIFGEQFHRVGPEVIQGRLNPRVTFLGTVAGRTSQPLL